MLVGSAVIGQTMDFSRSGIFSLNSSFFRIICYFGYVRAHAEAIPLLTFYRQSVLSRLKSLRMQWSQGVIQSIFRKSIKRPFIPEMRKKIF